MFVVSTPTVSSLYHSLFASDEIFKDSQVNTHVPYSGNLSRVKTFANLTVSGQFAKDLTSKSFIEYSNVVINGRVIDVSHHSRKF